MSVGHEVTDDITAPSASGRRAGRRKPNGLLRQYLPKGTDLSTHTATDLDAVAAALNTSPAPRNPLGGGPPPTV